MTDDEVRHVVVIGEMGVGKTTVGQALALALDRRFLDSDDAVETATGTNGRTIAEERGVAALHRMERGVFVDLVASTPPAVIAPAASVLDDADAQRVLTAHLTFWLRAPAAVIARRVVSGDHRRPVDPEVMHILSDRRAAASRACSLAQLDTSMLTVDQCVQFIVARIDVRR